jgi:group I intron endonuclease
MRGIIYKYVSPSNKVYIGQTVDEKKRRQVFLREDNDYAGIKINAARKKYTPSSFTYEVLEVVETNNQQELKDKLNILECYYIGLYDSFRNGYNMSKGGDGSSGYKLTQEHKDKIRTFLSTNNPFKGKKHTKKTKDIISKANSISVLQIDPITDEVLQEFSSAKSAGDSFGKPHANSEIIKVCRNYVTPMGRHYKTALGFKWKYKNEGSTTTETTLNNGKE